MKFSQYLRNSFRLFFLNEESLFNLAQERKSLYFGLIIVLISGIATSIYSFNISSILMNVLSLFAFVVFGFLFYNYIAIGLFNGDARSIEYLRVFLGLFLVYWVAVIPVIGIYVQILGTIWIFIVNIFILRKLHNLTNAKSIILGVLPLIILIAYAIILGDNLGY